MNSIHGWMRSAALFLLLASSVAAAPPPLATDGPKPFLSPCLETKFTNAANGYTWNPLSPTKEKVEAPFYDAPFALHVPLEVRHEGGPAAIAWSVSVTWDNAPAEWREPRDLSTTYFGLYRLDGKRPAENSISYFKGAMPWDADATLPSCVSLVKYKNGAQDAGSYDIEPEQEGHVPFRERGGSIQLQPAEPGWYALWLGLDTSRTWPSKDPKRDAIHGTFHVDMVVARGESAPTGDMIDYLFGRNPKKPSGMLEDKLYRASSVDVPFTLRRDAWVFDRSEVRVADTKRLDMKRILVNDQCARTFIAVDPKATGSDVQLQLTEKVQLEPRTQVTQTDDSSWDVVHVNEMTWQATFPEAIPDGSFAIMKIAGGQKKYFTQKPDWYSSPPVATYFWDSINNKEIVTESSGRTETFERVTSNIITPMEGEPSAEGLASWKADFLDEYGKDAADWFIPAYYKWPNSGPKEGEEPFRLVLRGVAPFQTTITNRNAIGSYPVLIYKLGPWYVIGHYKRLSEVEGRAVPATVEAGEATIVSDKQVFWKWYPQLSRVINKQKAIADKAVCDAAMEALPLRNLIVSQQKLLADQMSDALPANAGVGPKVGRALENGADALDQNFPRLGIGTLPGGSDPGSITAPVQLTPEAAKRKAEMLKSITAEIRERREYISRITADAKNAMAEILKAFDKAHDDYYESYGTEIMIWRREYQRLYELTPYMIAMATKDPVAIRRVLDESQVQGNSSQTRYLEAQLYAMQGDTISAVWSLRSAVRVDPSNTLAAAMLTELECSFLKTAIDKSQGAIKDARAAFYGYLMERGFDNKEIQATGDWPFARACSWSASAVRYYGEHAWAVFTTGIFGSFSAFYGKPAAEADLLATTERQMTTAFIGLHTMTFLRARGFTFDAIKKMTSRELVQAMPLQDVRGNAYTEPQMRLYAVAIHEAMKLPDIEALVSDDPDALRRGVQKAYWTDKDVGDTWIEYIGDVTSMYNLFMLLPGAKVGMGGKAGYFWTAADVQMMESLEKAGKVVSGTEAVANSIGLTRLLGAAGATERGQKLIKYMKQLEQYQQGLAWYDKVIWTSGKITGMLTINFTTVMATEKLAGHKAAMLLQACMMFAADTDTLIKLLDARNIPRQKIATLIINEYLPATQVHLKRLAMIEKSSFELEELFERVKLGRALSAEDFGFLDKHFGADWRKLVPNGQASHDATIAFLSATESARNGVDNGANAAVTELGNDLDAEFAATSQAADDAEKVVAALDDPATPVRGPPPPLESPTPPRELQRIMAITKRAEALAGGYAKPPAPKIRSETAKAERLLHQGKYVEAQAQYEEVLEKVLCGKLEEADELPLEWLHLRRCLAYELQVAKRLYPKGLSHINDAIPPGVAKEILNDPTKWIPNSDKGAMGDVFNVHGSDDYFVKVVRTKTIFQDVQGKTQVRMINVLEDVQGNMVHAELARACGINVPAMEVKFFYDANNNIEKAVYVMRKVKGELLSKKSAAEIFLYREELARHRALSVLIGDWDRKIDNYMVTTEGHLVAIDAGLADITGSRLAREAPEFAPTAPCMMEGFNGRDHWLARFFRDGDKQIELWSPNESFSRKGMVAEEALTYQAAQPTVDQLEKILASDEQFRKYLNDGLMNVYANEAEIDRLVKRLADMKRAGGETVDLADAATLQALRKTAMDSIRLNKVEPDIEKAMPFLRERGAVLDDCMRGLNERNGMSLPGGSGGQTLLRLPVVNPVDLRMAA